MKRSSLFGHVIELHDAIRLTRRPADVVAKEFFRSRHYLGSKDRRYISELLFGLLRNFTLVQVYAEEGMKQANPAAVRENMPAIVLLMAYCVKVMNEPADALLPEVSGLWRMSVPDTDCETFLKLLPSVSLPTSVEQDVVKGIATRFSFPESIVKEWVDRFGKEETERLCASLNTPAPITIRVNTLKATVEQSQAALQREGIEAQCTALSPVGLTLSKRFNTQSLQSFKNGHFEMQDEGSQLLSMLVEPKPGATIVDACAGGGGKTLHLGALMKNSGTIVAIDVEEQRLKNIHERIRRAGVSIVRTFLANRDEDLLERFHQKSDAVLIDAPCSGVGTFRRNPGAKLTFTDAFVEAIVRTQSEVLKKYASFVKKGGRLVYSTCTLLKKENEDQVSAFLTRHPDFELLSAPEILERQGVKVDSSSSFLTLLPHHTGTDGFFAAVMVRR